MKISTPIILGLLGVLGAAGCATTSEYFRPTERVVAEGRGGAPATAYEIRDASGKLGEANVWADGIRKGRVQGAKARLVYVGIRVKNLSTTPLMIDWRQLRLDGVESDGRLVGDGQLVGVQPVTGGGDLSIPPESVRDFQAEFAGPPGVTDVDAFRIRWGIVSADGRRFVQITPFVEDQEREALASGRYDYGYYGYYSPAYGFYDPFFYNPFGPQVVVVRHAPVARRHIHRGRY